MVSFSKRVATLLAEARKRKLLDEPASEALLSLAQEQDKEHGTLNLTSALAFLGGGILVVGCILLIAANWDEIPGWFKLLGFFALFVSVHGIGFWIRFTQKPWPATAGALNFIGAGLFLAGIGLVAQVFNLNSHAPNGILLWLLATVPLAFLLRSAPLTAMSIVALFIWGHMEGDSHDSAIKMPDSLAVHLMLELGIGTVLIVLSFLADSWDAAIAATLRIMGALACGLAIYIFGFYRYFCDDRSFSSERYGTWFWVIPIVAFLAGVAALLLGRRIIVPDWPFGRPRLALLLSGVLVMGAVAAGRDLGIIPKGPDLNFFNFDHWWGNHFDVAALAISLLAWGLWFLLAFWLVVYGAKAANKSIINIGVCAVGLGILTRFFDLVGSQATTGMIFVLGGLALLGTAWGMEKWRRKIIRQVKAAEQP